MQLRQLQELQASNEQREARLQAAQQRQEQLRKGYEDGLQANAAAQRELQVRRGDGPRDWVRRAGRWAGR